MKKLPTPIVDDESVWIDLASNIRLSDYKRLRSSAIYVFDRYRDYQTTDGDLRGFAPVAWAVSLEPRLKSLYDRPTSALAHIETIRLKGSPLVCPMCGGQGVNTLDHILHKSEYPELYLFSRNLVPACPCNSKRSTTYAGTKAGERILHPYYDDILKQRLARASFRPPYPTPKIRILVCVRTGPAAAAVRFHVKNTLAKTNVLEFWSDLWGSLMRDPRSIIGIDLNESVTHAELKKRLERLSLNAEAECGTRNNWRSMFYFGLIKTPSAVSFLLSRLGKVGSDPAQTLI